MKEFFNKLVKENTLIIILPAIFVTLLIVGFMIYGFSDPIRSTVTYEQTLLEKQVFQEKNLVDDYNLGTYTEQSPFFRLDPYDISPLSGIIMFETEDVRSYKIIVKGNTEEADWEFHTEETTSHRIPVLGLYAGQLNQVEMYRYYPETDVVGEIITTFPVVTEDLPEGVHIPTSIDTSYNYFGDDVMILMPAVDGLPAAYDFNGDVRWYSSEILAFAPDILENGRLLVGTDRVMSDPYYTTGLFEMDFNGKIYKEYYIPGGYHHDTYEMENGNFLVLSSDFQGTVEDIIVEIDRETGRIVKSWDLSNYLPTTQGMAEMWTSDDWFHNNSIDFDEFTDSIILSGRHQDIVISIDYHTETLNWVLGDPDMWDQEFVDEYFFNPIGISFEWHYAQHSAIVLPGDRIMLFDNGNNKAKVNTSYVEAKDSYSRAVIYQLDLDLMDVYIDYEFGKDLGSDFYSPYISNVEYYDDGHYMIHSGGISSSSTDGPLNIPAPLYQGEGIVTMSSITYELLNNTTQYRLEVPSNFYRAKRHSLYNENTSFSLGTALSLGVQEVTKQVTEEIDRKITLFKNVPAKYELELVKEGDRLRVEGIFDRADVIYLILKGENEDLVFNIPTSRTAYTAMCTAIFADDERYIRFYINEQNIYGKYNIYISVNGHEYDTYNKVTFK